MQRLHDMRGLLPGRECSPVCPAAAQGRNRCTALVSAGARAGCGHGGPGVYLPGAGALGEGQQSLEYQRSERRVHAPGSEGELGRAPGDLGSSARERAIGSQQRWCDGLSERLHRDCATVMMNIQGIYIELVKTQTAGQGGGGYMQPERAGGVLVAVIKQAEFEEEQERHRTYPLSSVAERA